MFEDMMMEDPSMLQMFDPQPQPIDSRSKKQIEKSLTGKAVSKLTRSRLLQMMAMNAAKRNAFGGGSQNG